MKIAVYGNRRQHGHIEQIETLLASLQAHGYSISMHPKLHDHLTELSGRNPGIDSVIGPGDDFEADMAISIGGDGTFLRTAAWVSDRQIPILGINTGHLGYLSDISIDETSTLADDLAAGNFTIESRALIEAELPYAPESFWPFALNEVAVIKKDTASMIAVRTCIDSVELNTYLGDGLILSTPTGSTGYNLSVGGPIIQPTAPNWVLSPVAAHSLTMRPLVISNDEELTITTTSRAGTFLLSIDGRSMSLPSGTVIKLRKAPFVTRVIHRANHNFAETLRSKLLWGIDNR